MTQVFQNWKWVFQPWQYCQAARILALAILSRGNPDLPALAILSSGKNVGVGHLLTLSCSAANLRPSSHSHMENGLLVELKKYLSKELNAKKYVPYIFPDPLNWSPHSHPPHQIKGTIQSKTYSFTLGLQSATKIGFCF